MPSFRELLADGRAHVFDGAMGTMLYGRGVFVNVCYDELSLRQPDLVRDIHREYLKAGAEVLETNTFGANPLKLAHYGLSGETEKINAAAATLAREAAGARAAVLGAIGPLGVRLEPYGETGAEEARAAFAHQAAGLLEGGVDGFILETFSDVSEVEAAIRAVRGLSDLPIVAQMTIGTDGRTHYGTEPAVFGPRLEAMGVDVIGVNCSVGPAGVLETVEKLARVVSLPISAQPNAGLPREVEDRKIYMASPEYMGTYAKWIVEAGARFVGGCCGTTPDHIREIAKFVQSVSPRHHAPLATAAAGGGADPGPAGRSLPAGRQTGGGRVPGDGRDRAAQGGESPAHVRAVPPAEGGGGGCGQCARRPPGSEPDGRAPLRPHDPARSRHRGRGPLRLPRPQPPRHALRSAGRRGERAQQPADRHRRPAQDGPLS
jgi:homocysteine S-methyltransferase